MQISKGIEITDTALFIRKEKILIINDLHIGYEEALHNKGILVPRFQLDEIIRKTKSILEEKKARKVIINGDLKHEFGKVLRREWKEVLQYLDFLLENVEEVIIIQGNHDPIIKPIADKKGVKVVKEFRIRDIHIVHGDEVIETDAKRIIIGHEHTAVTIREGSKWEKYKCFLKGKWRSKGKKNHELIVVPSSNPLIEGTDVLRDELLSPYLKKIDNFRIFIVNENEIFDFGKVKEIKKMKKINPVQD